jgi:hypothetical protein
LSGGFPEPASHSRAFETFVSGQDDLIGLIAYALYKQNLREVAQSGRPLPLAAARVPTPTEVSAYRGDAERKLQTFAANVVDVATPDIVERGVGIAIDAAKVELVEVINRRTSAKTAIVTNLAAWVITLAITVLLLVTIYLPNWQAGLIEHLKDIHWQPAPAVAPEGPATRAEPATKFGN